MRAVGAYEAKTHLSELLDAVVDGERVVITRHGHPIAILAPYAGPTADDVTEAVSALRAFRKGRRLGVSVRELIDEGRR